MRRILQKLLNGDDDRSSRSYDFIEVRPAWKTWVVWIIIATVCICLLWFFWQLG